MSFKPYTEKIKKKKWNLFDFRSDLDPDPDPHQNDTDPKHCQNVLIYIYDFPNAMAR